MKQLVFYVALATLAQTTGLKADWRKYWEQAGQTWAEKWINTLGNLNRFDRDDRMNALGGALGIGRYLPPGRVDDLPPEKREVYFRVREIMLATPDHARYFEEQIEKKRADVLANSKKDWRELNAIQDAGGSYETLGSYILYCERTAFPVLGHMPSAETVAVLGRYLNDPEGLDGKTMLGTPLIDDDSEIIPNAEHAAAAIRKLGIEDPPFRDDRTLGSFGASPGEIDAWRDWWNEVKAGRRTYRFKGNSTEYGPNGPASAAKLHSIERNRQRDAQRARRECRGAAAHDGAETGGRAGGGKAGWIVAIAGVLLIAAGAGWWTARMWRMSRDRT